ncbi:uncharacterized protein LOC130736753 [Lotus japonicus]|uniref:uncharacterized protein LOC130736753 n=1 Tax=Lotus japonicus TaxID=34305 RepID=UPI00258424E8|nr:uncharacterized protein LOC130736753 [Lotus japonicus]
MHVMVAGYGVDCGILFPNFKGMLMRGRMVWCFGWYKIGKQGKFGFLIVFVTCVRDTLYCGSAKTYVVNYNFVIFLTTETKAMDKSWISMPRNSLAYEQGVKSFLDFAFERSSVDGKILCPCVLCECRKWQIKDVVYDHLIVKQFPKNYTFWFYHRESGHVENENVGRENVSSSAQNIVTNENTIQNMLNEAFGVDRHRVNEPNEEFAQGEGEMSNVEQQGHQAREFYDLAKDGEQPLYEGCTRFSKLSFIVKLYHIKCLCKMTDKAMTMILELLHDAFEHAKIPSSFYEAKKSITKLGLGYEKIHACPRNCMLYWGADENLEQCKVCQRSRWREPETNGENQVSVDENCHKKVPRKVLRYFPLKPRLQRLFMSSKTAEDMRWHAVSANNDGMMRHPRDSAAWKEFDTKNTSFSGDPRNVRLGLAADGFNPHSVLSASNSIWPVILIPYNTPPWVCMKSTSFILSMIIPGKKPPGNDIDIYLQPLIKELKELWNDGVDAYDASKREMFKLYAALMWTISDFPGLSNLSGWNTYTGLACPTCNFDAVPCRLQHSKKWCFMGHRRFLDTRHKFRLNKIRFNGEQESRDAPKSLSGSEIFAQVKNINVVFGRKDKRVGNRKRSRGDRDSSQSGTQQWKKKSIFFELPYWEHNKLRHNLDVMHIEKNVCENILFTLLNDGKSKDHLKARKDLQAMGFRHDLWPDENGKYPLAIYTMTNQGKKSFLTTLSNIIVPDGYSSNISRCIDMENFRLSGMLKSHDFHILMEQLLPLAMRTTVPNEVSKVLNGLSSFFRKLCSKVLSVPDLDRLQHDIVLTLCNMEILFPPSFFTVMVHLIVHLVEEAKLGGPVYYRWMYPIERYLGLLKSYVRNKAQPTGSIAEGYLMQEILTFCSRYLDDIETVWNRPRRVDDEPIDTQPKTREAELFPKVGKSVGRHSYFTLSSVEKLQAHRHVLTNCPIVDPYLQKFRDIVRRQLRRTTRSASEIDKKVHKEFAGWFYNHIFSNANDLNEADKSVLLCLAEGPEREARRFSAYNVNGYKFGTVARDKGLRTQNSGVFGSFGTRSYSSRSDTQMRFGGVPYYGKLIDIIELSYSGLFTVPLFKCKWANTTNPRGMKKDDLGFTSINFTRPIHTGDHEDDEPFINASEAQMVFYVDDEKEKGWSIPIHLNPRDLYDMGEVIEEVIVSDEAFPSQNLEEIFPDTTEHVQLARVATDDDPLDYIIVENIDGDDIQDYIVT